MVTREAIVAEALEWLNTPLSWGQSCKGKGCDCIGWIFGVARELGMPEAVRADPFRRGYRRASPDRLIAGLQASMVPTGRMMPGDVLALPVPGISGPAHLAMLVAPGKIMHSYGRGIDRVVMVPLGRDRAIHSVWTWPSLGGVA